MDSTSKMDSVLFLLFNFHAPLVIGVQFSLFLHIFKLFIWTNKISFRENATNWFFKDCFHCLAQTLPMRCGAPGNEGEGGF